MARAADQDLIGYVESAIAGDELAFARIVSEFHEQVYSIAMVVCRDHLLAERPSRRSPSRRSRPAPSSRPSGLHDALRRPVGVTRPGFVVSDVLRH